MVALLDFDPQGGKDPAGLGWSPFHIYINKGQIVTKAEEMLIALLCHGGVSNVRVFMW